MHSLQYILHGYRPNEEENLFPMCPRCQHTALLIIAISCNFPAISETVEVPQDADNYYSEALSEEEFEPEITIIKKKKSIHEEYRLNGKLYMVKVIPSSGPSYFYIDQDGDGILESKSTSRNLSELVPQWVIFSW